MWKTLSSGKNWHGRLINKHKDGSLYTEESNISPVFDDNGAIQYYVAAKLDISAEIRREEEYRQAQKMEAIGQFAGGVAHDFNNMLSVIIGRAELGMRKLDSENPLYAIFQEIQKTAQRSANLTQQLLAYARKQPASPTVQKLNQSIEGILDLLRQLIGKGIQLNWIPGACSCRVNIDFGHLDQILTNLTINARDAIGSKGTINIETEEVTLDEACCDSHAKFIPGTYAVLTVSDDGKGMDRETLKRIFEPFFTTKGLGQGTGLGLAIVYGAVRQNQGFIDVRSELGSGTTFKIYLPKVMPADIVVTAKSNPAPRKHGKTILLVEDEADLLEVVGVMLSELGYEVLAANSPKEAISIVENATGTINILITDIMMPGMNGRELSRYLQKLNPDLKVLFMSGFTSEIVLQSEIQNKDVHFMAKPFSLKELATNLNGLIDK